jgi:voltage-gated potassium channel
VRRQAAGERERVCVSNGAKKLAVDPGSQPFTVRRAVRAIASVTVLVTVASGIAMRLVDSDEFPNVWLGLWWATQTVTTVGYGDITPTHPGGRLIAVVVMLTGIGFITVVTATITASFVEGARRRHRGEDSDSIEARLDGIAERLERIEAQLAARP